ncbi:hypothetical protein PHYPSEUDO_014328 [Phytophthora pseudosyringae]|uniref:Cyclic nucleotide-binding domain-containing protein n=1 Tax=Phytophthora pseudosyringae TaxID=221518 RepID=A0A8T1WI34_9STRA|nr:hypothetical protein PHYPSEUDO_014328 [Phytophthora pseudosyringae]
MSEVAPTAMASGRYSLRTHELAPVLLPRPRGTSSPSSPGSTEREDFNAVSPVRPRGSLAGASSPYRGRVVLESVAFDPFSGSESFKLLLQNPETSSNRRQDPRAVAEFRQWLSQHFPLLLRTFRALRMINAKTARVHEEDLTDSLAQDEPAANQCSGGFDETGEREEVDSVEEAGDCDDAWRLIFRYATVLSATPGETIAIQSITRTESVYFLFNGHCELSLRPVLVRDFGKTPSAPATLPRMPAGVLGRSDRPVIHLRELAAGDCFGLDAAAFGFEYTLSTATAGSARQRNFLGLREVSLTYVLCLPYQAIQQLQLLQRRHHDDSARLPPSFPYSFAPEAEVFLRNTFLFRTMADSSRRFLAAHLRPVVIAQQEYLFTPGQPARVFIVIAGQLTLGDPREEHPGVRKEVDLELELLQAHDSVGLVEVLRLAISFERYCAVTSANGARAYALPSTVLHMVLAQEPSTLKLIHEWIAHRQSWYELRRATALAQRKIFTAEGSEHVVRLTLAAQRRSKLTCSRCGWAGHVSTSLACVRVDIPVSEPATLPMVQLDKRGRRSGEGSRAARQLARRSEFPSRSERSESVDATPVQQLPFTITPVGPTSPPRTPAHRRLQVDSIALRALQISRIPMAERLQSDDSASPDTGTEEEQYTNSRAPSFKTSKHDALRSCALTQSLQRLEAALQHKRTPSVQQEEI